MRLLNPWGLTALLLAVPIIILYMLRMHRQRVVVPSLLLWNAALQDKRANRPWQKLKRNWLLFLQLLILALMVMSLVQPALPVPAQVQGHTLILIDASASMQTQDADGNSRFDTTRDALHQAVNSLRSTDRATLIVVSAEPYVALRDGNPADLRRALDTLEAGDGSADWTTAASLANAWVAVTPSDGLNTLLATDRAFAGDIPALPGNLQLIDIGNDADNVGISQMAVRRAGEGFAVFAQVVNHGEAITRKAQLIVDGVPVQQATLDLPENGSLPLIFDVDSIEGWVEVRLLESDALSLDDRAWVALSASAEQAVALVLPQVGNVFLQRALNAMPGMEFTLLNPGADASQYTTAVLDRAWIALEGVDAWYIAPTVETPCGTPTGVITGTGSIRNTTPHPITYQVEWADVHVGQLQSYDTPADAQVLATTDSTPALWLVDRPEGRTVCLGFDLHASDFPLRVAYPVLTANIMAWLRPDQGVQPVRAIPAGRTWTPDLPPQAADIRVTLPDGDSRAYSPGDSLPGDAGLYRFDIESPSSTQQFAAGSLLDAAESDLRAQSLTVSGTVVTPLGEAPPVWRTFTPWLVGIALALLLVEAFLWWSQSWSGWLTFTTQALPIMLHLVVILSVLAALLDVRITRRTRDLNIVLLVDRSASTRAAWDQQENFINDLLDAKHSGDQVGVIAFGADAWVDQPLSPAPSFTLGTAVDGSATDLEAAVRLALPMLPEDAPSRLVILSDGLETDGDAVLALHQAQAAGVDVQFVPWETPPSAEVWLADVRLPGTVAVGDVVPVAVTLQGNTKQTVDLTWTGAGQTGAQSVALDASSQVWVTQVQAASPGFLAVEVCLNAPLDTYGENNCAYGWTMVEGPPGVLLVGEARETTTIHAALNAAGLNVDAIPTGDLPITAEGLSGYATVILANTPARDIGVNAQQALQEYVQRFGGGLLAVGGNTSFGVGGWLGTPIEEVLPLEMRVQDPRRFPPLAVVVVIDTSGSMAAEEAGTTKIKLAAEAAARVVETLNDADSVAVVAFDDRPTDILGPVTGAERDDILAQISKLRAGGGGIYVYDSLRVAAQLLADQDVGDGVLQHIILMADGSDAEQQEGAFELADAVSEAGVTISTVSLGRGLDTHFLEQLAERANGRAYVASSASALPAIFAEDTARAKRSYIVEKAFVPEVITAWQPVADVQAVPSLLGYVATAPKPTAQVVWNALDGDPLLAVWQSGLGHSAAWTSDSGLRWAQSWASWEDMPRFWGSITRALMSPPTTPGTALSVVNRDGIAYAVADVYSEGVPADGLTLDVQTGYSTQPISMTQVAPGRYEAPLPAGATDDTVRLLRLDGDRSAFTGWAAEPPRESIPGDGQAAVARLAAMLDAPLIEDAADAVTRDRTGVRQGAPLVAYLLWFAAVVWVLDIAARRLGWRLRRRVCRKPREEDIEVEEETPVEEDNEPQSTVGALRDKIRR